MVKRRGAGGAKGGVRLAFVSVSGCRVRYPCIVFVGRDHHVVSCLFGETERRVGGLISILPKFTSSRSLEAYGGEIDSKWPRFVHRTFPKLFPNVVPSVMPCFRVCFRSGDYNICTT